MDLSPIGLPLPSPSVCRKEQKKKRRRRNDKRGKKGKKEKKNRTEIKPKTGRLTLFGWILNLILGFSCFGLMISGEWLSGWV